MKLASFNIYRFVRRVMTLLAVVGLGMLVWLSWRWMAELRCNGLEFSGLRHANPETLADMARVDTGMLLIEVDPDLVADRMQRHPWVKEVNVLRRPTGKLSIYVEERSPEVLVLDRLGQPTHYLDREGFALPLVSDEIYEVPLLVGLTEPYRPLFPVRNPLAVELLGALAGAKDETDALISELVLDPEGGVFLYTSPVENHATIPVNLGAHNFREKLAWITAFWRQAVLTQPEKSFTLIDLRYENQVVSREVPKEISTEVEPVVRTP